MKTIKTIKLILIGLGNVGQGFLRILNEDNARLENDLGIRFDLVAISNLKFGNFVNPEGFNISALLAALDARDLSPFSAYRTDRSTAEMIEHTQAEYLLEASFTNFDTAEPALTYMRSAIGSGKNVVTANKGPIALRYQELRTLAENNKLKLGVEGTVMGGTPTMRMGMDILRAADIQKVQGILNGTTNFILTKMGAGQSYAEALAEAQALGFAEAEPTGDVEGFDAAGKVIILSNILMGTNLGFKDLSIEGISKLTIADVEKAKAQNAVWKLIGSVEKTAKGVKASVAPVMLPNTHPLAGVSGATNAITFTTKLMGDVTLIGAGAGRIETGYALLNDILMIEGSKHSLEA